MNDVFDIKRFTWLLKKSVLEQPAMLIGLLAVTITITLLTYAIVQSMIGIGKAQLSAFILGFLVGGSFMASSVFGYFSSKSNGVSYLLLPASHLEKWLCGIIISGVLFVIIYLGFYRLIDVFFVNSYRNNLDHNAINYQILYNSVEIFSFNNSISRLVFATFFNISGAMLLGSLYFNKVSYIKVSLLICILIIGTYFLNLFFASFFFEHIDLAVPFRNIFLKVDKEIGIIDMPSAPANAASFAIAYLIPAALWVLAYLRLKEKEV
ncbi:hypothetical protein [uncultured Flavobacterium sp.]|uniref:hypothetical protein n=1 Tax=uncultured Flavobacterium sp. TaxID=165435 RepID=UPI002930750E|nr:hypothetical protein [uncultured Flavobacterium sp.]